MDGKVATPQRGATGSYNRYNWEISLTVRKATPSKAFNVLPSFGQKSPIHQVVQ
jgi:hypothetical protein